jgi:hypothetical protein
MVLGDAISTVGSRVKELFRPAAKEEPAQLEPPEILPKTGFEGSLEGAEVVGRSPMSYLAASETVSTMMGRQTSMKLGRYGVDDIDPDEWYPLRSALAMLYETREEYGSSSMQMMGRHIPEHVEFPPDIDSVDGALGSIGAAYHQNHRGGDIGYYEYHDEGAGEGRVVCSNPYPCELDQGLIKGVALEFADSYVEVEEVGDGCRKDGDEVCEYSVEWIEV